VSTKTSTSLSDRVYELLGDDDTGVQALNRCSSEPAGVHPTLRESHMRDWGFVYGVAYGLALSERSANEDGQEVARRAMDAARGAWGRWAGLVFPPRHSLSPLVDEVLAAFNEAELELMPAIYGTAPLKGSARARALCESLNRLLDAVGLPDEAVTDR